MPYSVCVCVRAAVMEIIANRANVYLWGHTYFLGLVKTNALQLALRFIMQWIMITDLLQAFPARGFHICYMWWEHARQLTSNEVKYNYIHCIQ